MTVEVIPCSLRNKFTDRAFMVFLRGEHVMTVGLKTHVLASRQLYLWLIPKPSLRKMRLSDWKELRKTLGEIGKARLVCNIRSHDLPALRFAKFFGFSVLQQVDDILICERKVG